MKIEVLMMRVIVGMVHLNIGHSILQKSSGKQAVLSKLAGAVSLLIACGFSADFEHVSVSQQLASLIIGKVIGLSLCGATSS